MARSTADEIEKELDQTLVLSERLRHAVPVGGSILKRAFEGRLVSQREEGDGDARELVERIRKKRHLAL
ncbi:MAG: hypothetical protein KKD28_03610 [Chloroflexi bacterium]|nr:hypothetical protein [Chloroflexota bacterium]MBU1660542.1 hypothetical protein [Chloroflexota bacterium]